MNEATRKALEDLTSVEKRERTKVLLQTHQKGREREHAVSALVDETFPPYGLLEYKKDWVNLEELVTALEEWVSKDST